MHATRQVVPSMGGCQTCGLRHRAVCSALSDTELDDLQRISHRKSYAAGSTVAHEGEPIDYFANILGGVIKLTKTLADGRQQIVGLLFPTDFLGRAFVTESPYRAEAATDLELCAFPHSSFEKLMGKYPQLEHRLLESALSELDTAREWMLLLGRKTAEEKVASFLHLLAKRAMLSAPCNANFDGPLRFQLPLTRTDMADYLGLTIETVSRQITRLKKQGVISLVDNRTIEVPEVDDLADISGG